jgi:D-tyrosyl-tRNA(Tyr) deacylase
MRTVIQVCEKASVEVDGKVHGMIDEGMLVYLGVSEDDSIADADYIIDKLQNIRIFKDSQGKTNLNIAQAGGEFLIISQFTLFGDLRKGRRPSYNKAAEPQKAEELYLYVIEQLRKKGYHVENGCFGSYMHVDYINLGPETFLLDSERIF